MHFSIVSSHGLVRLKIGYADGSVFSWANELNNVRLIVGIALIVKLTLIGISLYALVLHLAHILDTPGHQAKRPATLNRQ